ncbi:MAG: response regulator [Bacteroidetes bacterium]|nr:response regulator [Bacteroidota bacterium]
METYIVEDSRLAREELARLCSEIDELEIVGQASDADTAISDIEELHPDLLLLDIQLPGKDGFELLQELDHLPFVIFVTAYDEYAVKAFEVNALDYLTKPVNPDRLSESVNKVKEKIEKRAKENSAKNVLAEESRVFVKDGERCWFVRVGDIHLFESEGNYTKIHFGDQKPMIHKSLTYLEERLDEDLFFRVNRSQMVNLKKIGKVDPWFSNTIKITLDDGKEVEVSRRQTRQFRDKMSF